MNKRFDSYMNLVDRYRFIRRSNRIVVMLLPIIVNLVYFAAASFLPYFFRRLVRLVAILMLFSVWDVWGFTERYDNKTGYLKAVLIPSATIVLTLVFALCYDFFDFNLDIKKAVHYYVLIMLRGKGSFTWDIYSAVPGAITDLLIYLGFFTYGYVMGGKYEKYEAEEKAKRLQQTENNE